MKHYIMYSPEFDIFVICSKRQKSFHRDAFKDGLRGRTPLFFIAYADVGFK